jgi:oligosaccharyltransferase complex subunit beta
LSDLQVEFTMLDPHIRTALLPVSGKQGLYRAAFRVPDRHGVFKFVLDYRRRGWTTLKAAMVVPVVPPRHDGYPRFLSAAWPYYAGAISTSIGFLVFATLWLAGDDKEGKKGKSAKIE